MTFLTAYFCIKRFDNANYFSYTFGMSVELVLPENYDAVNFLFLVNKEVGEHFLLKGTPVLGPSFKLSIPLILKTISNSKLEQPEKLPAFLEKGKRSVKKAFQRALECMQQNSQIFAENKDMESLLPFLKVREAVLEMAIENCKTADFNSVENYLNIRGVSPEIDDALIQSYTQKIDYEKALKQINNFFITQTSKPEPKTSKILKQENKVQLSQENNTEKLSEKTVVKHKPKQKPKKSTREIEIEM